MTLHLLRSWAAERGQTVERIRRAMRELKPARDVIAMRRTRHSTRLLLDRQCLLGVTGAIPDVEILDRTTGGLPTTTPISSGSIGSCPGSINGPYGCSMRRPQPN